ncbi:Hypothetical protein MYEA_3370 [Mycoplasma yeatsii 13926]|uniref:ATPase n=1 Tax=Mycoplasma yeatsii 13926 TaxID=1188240 RepID=S6G3X5_9MOLU|nr:DUF4143 domain-containing protein [Mycoplasma yeatsii]EOA07272.1 Hypothetical protein MYEA_3370 [Mycoplasma yeatsii 13926]
MRNDNYKPRIMDKVIQRYLSIAGAICVEGPKWCGKTWTSRHNSKSEFLVGSPYNNFANRKLANFNPELVLDGEYPKMIDEWQEAPALWDATRAKVDEIGEKGLFILTGSATPKYKGILHSGAGRIVSLRMSPMTLYESEDSVGIVSLKEICSKDFNPKPTYVKELDYEQLSYLIVRGGWPNNIGSSIDNCDVIVKSYIKTILKQELVDENDNKYSPEKIELILKSLARNTSTTVSDRSILKDISQNENDNPISRPTLTKYLDFLNSMFLFDNLKPFSLDARSSLRVKQKDKRYFCDPSLACALLDLSPAKIQRDLNLYGLLFESLVIRDLKVYSRAMDAKIYHYQDYLDNEIDVVIELKDGDWCAFEIKLGSNKVDEAAETLNKTISNIVKNNNRPPILKCIIVGFGNVIYKREDGILVVPINALKD